MKKLLHLLLFIFIFYSAYNLKLYATTPDASLIITNPGEDMSSQINISWHTEVTGTYVQYTKASDVDYNNAQTKIGVCSNVPFDSNPTTLQCKASISNLEKDTKYIYRVGFMNFSESYSFKTAGDGSFSFAHVTDIHSYKSGLNNTRVIAANSVLNKLYDIGKDNIAFTVFSGDSTAYGTVYEQWQTLYTMDSIKKGVSAFTPGNHDYYNSSAQVTDIKYFNSVINNPSNGATGLDGSTYFFKYNNALFISINSEASAYSQTHLQNQQNWFKQIIENNPTEFIIVYTHRPFYTGDGENASQAADSRSWWQSIFDQYGVDLVLTGHNHVYARTYPVYNNNALVDTTTNGTVYITGFQIGDRYKTAVGTPMPQVAFSQIGKDENGSVINAGTLFTVSDNAINLQFIKTDGTILDSYQINSKSTTFNTNNYTNSLKITSNTNDFSKATFSSINPGIARINKIEIIGSDNQILASKINPNNITTLNLTNIPTNVSEYGVNVRVTLRTGEIINKNFNLINEKRQYGVINNLRIENNIDNKTCFYWNSDLINGRLTKLQLFINGELYSQIDPYINDSFIMMDDVSPYKLNQLEFRALNNDNEIVYTETISYGENAEDVLLSYEYDKQTITVGDKVTPSYVVIPNQNLELEYTSSNPEVASVNELGEITALKPGVAIISMNVVKRWDVNSSIEITVKEKEEPLPPQDPQIPQQPQIPKEDTKKGCFQSNSLISIGILGLIVIFRKRRIF